MHLELIDVDKFCQDLPEISSQKVFESGKFAKKGLFSQQIFGPVKSYYCACSKGGYRGRNSVEETCKACNVDICSSAERRKRFAKIVLPFRILNPIFYYIIIQLKPSLKTTLNDMISYRNEYYFDDQFKIHKILPPGQNGEAMELDENGDPLKDIDDNIIYEPFDGEKYAGLKGVLAIIQNLIEQDDSGPEIQFLRDNFNNATIKNAIVIPPDFRPCGKNQSGVNVSDEVNHFYSTLIVKSTYMKAIPYNLNESDDIYKTNYKHIQNSVISLYDYVLGKLSKKKGLIRSNILGKRVDFSGRAVISPDPTLSLDTCRIPYFMLMELLKPQLVVYLVKRRVCKRYNQANKMIDDAIRTQDSSLFDVVNDFCDGKTCILNRQPTLHRLGMLAFKITTHLGNTVQIHPMVCPPFNADFDGDAMAIYFPVTEKANRDILKLGIWNNLISPTDLSLVPGPSQDIILGIWAASSTTCDDAMKVTFKDTLMTPEMEQVNRCFPEDYPVQTVPLNGKKLKRLLNDIAFKYPPSTVMATLDRIKRLGFTMATIEGFSLSINDLYNPELVNIANNLTGNYTEDTKRTDADDVQDMLHGLPCATFIVSGARGSWEQCKQLVLSRGYVSDSTGNVRNKLIRNSLVNGLTQSEFCDSSWGSRKGLLDTAMSTGDSGYLTRQLIYSTINVSIDQTLDDCGTDEFAPIFVTDKDMAHTLLWRYYIRDDGTLGRITQRNCKDFIGKTIKLRSPIYCIGKHICKKCYGDLYKILHSDQIGIIATQAIGEITTQLVLRTFHTSGVAEAVDANVAQHTGATQGGIVSGMGLANKLFHSPGSLEGLNDPMDLVNMIYKLFNPYKGIHMIHYEIICSSMMWADNRPWRTLENRDDAEWGWTSILKIPSQSSWLLGAAFSNVKNKLLDGVIKNRIDDPSAITKLFRL